MCGNNYKIKDYCGGTLKMDYILITPAFNEEKYIESTIKSVIQQTIKPRKWIIVDDGSVDGTAGIAKKYCNNYDFIEYYYRTKLGNQSYFASNVYAIMEGYKTISKLKFDYLAILDADIILPEDYYERIFSYFKQDKKLGIASGIYENLVKGQLQKVLNDRRSTPKALQVFKREVFDQIGGFLPLKYGGEDTCACVMARMYDWKTWSFPDIKTVHLKPTGTGNAKNIIKAKINMGLCEYGLGNLFLFVLLKSLRRMVKEKPYFFGGFARLLGFSLGVIRHGKSTIPKEVIVFNRGEQYRRIISNNHIQEKFRFNNS